MVGPIPVTRTAADLDFLGYRGVSLHPYPATMPYPLAEELVSRWSRPGDHVLDPFVGSGTTIRAAVVNGRRATGIDINPLATLIARVTVRRFDMQSDIARYDAARIMVLDSVGSDTSFPDSGWFERIDRWFPKASSEGLGQLAAGIRKASMDPDLADFILLAFSRTVRQSSLARPGELKLWKRADPVKWESPLDIFAREASNLLWSIVSLNAQRSIPKEAVASIITSDAEHALNSVRKCQLALTSPPYGDAWTTVAYGNFTLLSRIWLATLDGSFVKNNPVTEDARALGGAERLRKRQRLPDLLALSPDLTRCYEAISDISPDRADELLLFCNDMYAVLSKLKTAMSARSRLIMVLGPRRMAGTLVDTGLLLGDFLRNLGYSHVRRDTRRISGKRLPTKTMQGLQGVGETINQETIDVFERVAGYQTLSVTLNA